jgi:hypothetical protein
MNRFCLSAIFVAALLVSCAGKPDRPVVPPPDIPGTQEPLEYTIVDHKNFSGGKDIPEWVSLWLKQGVNRVEALDAFRGRYAFIQRSEGHNFNALRLWNDGFSPALDFPRLAAARVEKRLCSNVFNPFDEYGAFYEAVIRSVADAQWTGAVREDDFWILKKLTSEALAAESAGREAEDREIWEFFILVTIEKTAFASRLDQIFKNVNLDPSPSRAQAAAVERVKSHFFEGF